MHVPEDPSPFSSHSPACDNCGPIPAAQYPGVPGVLTLLLFPPSGCSDAQPEDRNPSTTSLRPTFVGAASSGAPHFTWGNLSSGGPSFRGLGCSWHKPLLRSMSPCAPLPSGPISTCAPMFTAPNTGLLARSFLHTPRALPPAEGWWPATSTFPGRSGSPPRGSP